MNVIITVNARLWYSSVCMAGQLDRDRYSESAPPNVCTFFCLLWTYCSKQTNQEKPQNKVHYRGKNLITETHLTDDEHLLFLPSPWIHLYNKERVVCTWKKMATGSDKTSARLCRLFNVSDYSPLFSRAVYRRLGAVSYAFVDRVSPCCNVSFHAFSLESFHGNVSHKTGKIANTAAQASSYSIRRVSKLTISQECSLIKCLGNSYPLCTGHERSERPLFVWPTATHNR